MVPLNLSFKFLREYKQENVQSCTKWAVVTTIFEPSPSVKAVAQSPSWCLVIVGDIKSPKSYNISGIKSDAKIDSAVIYLNEEDQVQLASFIPFVRELPWNHFGRKNVGYLYAIMHGAQIVWDFDDDNMLLQESILPSIVNPYFESIVHNTSIDVYEYESSFLSKTFGMSFNPYPMMGASSK